MKPKSKNRGGEAFWPKIVLRKWLNISNKDSDFSADESDADSQLDDEDMCSYEPEQSNRRRALIRQLTGVNENAPSHRRRKSETVRAQYINHKELRVWVGTWNVGGKLPSRDLDIKDWLNTEEPADIYAIGLQEIVPLNAGNIFGAEDNRSVPRWETLIRETLNSAQPPKLTVKCFSDPPSPSRFNPSDDQDAFDDEILPMVDSDSEEDDKVHPSQDPSPRESIDEDLDNIQGVLSYKKLERLNGFSMVQADEDTEAIKINQRKCFSRSLSKSERIGLTWPEQPLELTKLQQIRSFRGVDFSANTRQNKRSSYVRIISKQMVGVYTSIWVRRGLRKHIQNLKVSSVGVGVMGYIGNKGAISVSMSIYQTLFCFVSCHLTAGEKEGDELRRNADVLEIHRRTVFHAIHGVNMPRTIYDHEKIIWLGDLNYRLNASYERTRELIRRKQWSKLLEMDQLTNELKKGRAFDGWSEGVIDFPPTYKYEPDSDVYVGEDPKTGRRTPAWCDRILYLGKGMRLMRYGRNDLRLSDHRPVAAEIAADVEIFSHRKLQKALTFTDAEIEDEPSLPLYL